MSMGKSIAKKFAFDKKFPAAKSVYGKTWKPPKYFVFYNTENGAMNRRYVISLLFGLYFKIDRALIYRRQKSMVKQEGYRETVNCKLYTANYDLALWTVYTVNYSLQSIQTKITANSTLNKLQTVICNS